MPSYQYDFWNELFKSALHSSNLSASFTYQGARLASIRTMLFRKKKTFEAQHSAYYSTFYIEDVRELSIDSYLLVLRQERKFGGCAVPKTEAERSILPDQEPNTEGKLTAEELAAIHAELNHG